MKKRMFVYFLFVTVCLFHLLVPDAVFGQALQVFNEYKDTFRRQDVHEHFPEVLRGFKTPKSQALARPTFIRTVINKPERLRSRYYEEADDSILALLITSSDFRKLFEDAQFHALLRNTAQIEELAQQIEDIPTSDLIQPQDCKVPKPAPPTVPTGLTGLYGNNQSGEVGEPLAQPFVVGVLDQNGKPLQGTAVTFKITRGSGQLSETTDTTDVYGQARTTLTLGAGAGYHSVRASVSGITQTRTFTATAKASVPEITQTQTFTATEDPPLPPMYWIEANIIYHRPTGGGKEIFLEPQDGIFLTGGLAVDTVGRKVYWTEKRSRMGKLKGWIQSRSLDDQTVEEVKTIEVKTIQAEPLGIAVGTDRANDRWVYWTTSNKKIHRINVDGSGFKGDFMELPTLPKHIAFDQEEFRLYWTEMGRIRRVAPNGKGERRTIEGLGKLGGIAVADGKVYWTEQTDTGQGTLQGAVKSVNGNGSGGKLLAGLESIPEGIAVDAVGGKVYWTTSRGYIQSAPLTGIIEPVVEGNDTRAVGLTVVSSSMDKMGAAPSAAAPSISPVDSVENTLLANYPNPFNPETWIPYQLSKPADVSVSIYSVNGHLVRRLDLGHQSAGVYRSRSRAAYWDGRNAFGERVASGLYFYTLTAGDFTATRKMLIRK